MTRLAITGHRGMPHETERLIDQELRATLVELADSDLTGVSAIADGADTLFARAVLDAAGTLIVIIPAKEYRDGLPSEHHSVYDELLSHASRVISLDHILSNSEAHMQASLRMLDEADHLIAVWDGQPARGYGGTADVVHAARERRLPVTVIWPPGAIRD